MEKKEFVLKKLQACKAKGLSLDTVAYESEVSRKTVFNVMQPGAKMSEATLDKLFAYFKVKK